MTNKLGPFSYTNSIMTTKKYLNDLSQYIPFITNRHLSQYIDMLLYANEMNQMSILPKKLQYDYLFGSIRKMKRPFKKWPKKYNSDDIKLVANHYSVSYHKAHKYLEILSPKQLEEIKEENNLNNT